MTHVAVMVTNTGNSSTFIAPDAVTITLAMDGGRLDDITVRGSDNVSTFTHPGALAFAEPPAMRSSPARANVIRLRRIFLAAGETQPMATLRIRADRATRIHGVWSARCPGGFESANGVVDKVEVIRGIGPPR